jgi:Ca-activated chloride channel family protein
MLPRNARTLLSLASTIVAIVAPALAVAQKANLAVTPAGSAAAGSTVAVQWTGPNSRGDYVAIAPLGAEVSAYLDWKDTAAGSPTSLKLPIEPGRYEFRYVLATPQTVIAVVPYEVLPVEATVKAPQNAEAGGTIAIFWIGPNQPGDWITIVEPSANPSAYGSYVDADKGTRTLDAPVNPGSYEIRYVQAGINVLVRTPIEITDVKADVAGPSSVAPGAAFEVSWKGPNNTGDWITIVTASAAAQSYGSYVDVKAGMTTATLQAPDQAGTYELRYVLGGVRVIATRPIAVTAGKPEDPGSALRDVAAVIPAPRTIEIQGFAGVGTGATSGPSATESAVTLPAPRTIPLDGFAGVGTGSLSDPREKALPAPRTIPLAGFTGVGTGNSVKTP